ncbi:MAG TPA: hypothetical protein VMN36_12020 [Verrucomicrobiales bacterium]|nr:hypothetical protein [Verrucomicrobiales bacterium]
MQDLPPESGSLCPGGRLAWNCDILNLAVWFAFHAIFPGVAAEGSAASWNLDWFVAAAAVLLFALLARQKLGVVAIVGLGAALGLLRHATGI